MICRTARDYYLRSRDKKLDEAEKIRLQQHLSVCPDCALYCREMDDCLSLLDTLPEMELPESFDWNVKRMIALEKSRVMRERAGSIFGNPAWGKKFVFSAAAVFMIVLAGAWFILDDNSSQDLSLGNLAQADVKAVASERAYNSIRYTKTGYPAGIKMVSDDFYGRGDMDSYNRQLPFSMESERRLEYLLRENKVLREYIVLYKEENLRLKRMLLQKSSRR